MPAAASASVAARALSLISIARRMASISAASLWRRMREMAECASRMVASGKARRSASASKTRIRWPSTPIRAGAMRPASAAKAPSKPSESCQ